MKRDLYIEVSATIAAQLEQGVAPWVKPWASTAGRNMPHNAITGRRYSGCNVIMLWSAMNRPDFTIPAFATWKQIHDAGATVKKEENKNYTPVYFVKRVESKTKTKKDGTPQDFFMLRAFYVYNIAQCENLPAKFTNPASVAPRNNDLRDATIDEFLVATGAEIHHGGDRAFYMPSRDSITMPNFESFKGAADYYGTICHELAHWTGHASRLNREFGKRFGDKAYAAEELVAELTAAFLAAEFDLDGRLQHAEYIATWIRLLKDDSKAFFTACSKAQNAADYLRQKALADDGAAEAA